MPGSIEGQVIRVMVALDANSLASTRRTRVRVTMAGFEGDKHSGMTRLSDSRTPHYPRGTEIRNNRQVSLVSDEELAEVAAALELPLVLPEWLGANLALRNIPKLSLLPPSSRLFFPQDAVLVVEGENFPCIYPGEVIQQQYPERPGLVTAFPKAALHRRGIVAWVERPGVINEYDTVRAEVARQVLYDFAT